MFLGQLKLTRTLALTLNSLATFSTTSGASAELLITAISEQMLTKRID